MYSNDISACSFGYLGCHFIRRTDIIGGIVARSQGYLSHAFGDIVSRHQIRKLTAGNKVGLMNAVYCYCVFTFICGIEHTVGYRQRNRIREIIILGITEATNVVLRDAFSPAPAGLTVSINGTAVPSSGYTYTDGVLTLPSTATAITLTVPAATFTQDATTGAVTINPGMTTVTVSGTI